MILISCTVNKQKLCFVARVSFFLQGLPSAGASAAAAGVSSVAGAAAGVRR